jgi:hypothetical protein
VTRSYFRLEGGLVPETIKSSINYSGVADLVLNTGLGGNMITLSASARNLDELPHAVATLGFSAEGSVAVHGGPTDTLILNDQNNAQASTWTVTGDAVTRSYATLVGGLLPETVTSFINYTGLAALTLNGGSGGDLFDVQSTSASTAISPALRMFLYDEAGNVGSKHRHLFFR